MPELAMASPRHYMIPSVVMKSLENLADFHACQSCNVVVIAQKAMIVSDASWK
jgi:hypothetical protein